MTKTDIDSEKTEESLFALSKEKYGKDYEEHLFEQYKLYVESHEKVSDRRQKTNEFFLALNTALLTALGFAEGKLHTDSTLIFVLAAIAGITSSYFWHGIISAYKGLNTGKFTLIHLIEKRLPASLYKTEWDVLKHGKVKGVYWPFSHIELNLPKIFMVIYLIIVLYAIPWSSFFSLFHFLKCLII